MQLPIRGFDGPAIARTDAGIIVTDVLLEDICQPCSHIFSACMSDPLSKFYFIPPDELHRLIRLIGLDSVFISSDLGQHDTPPFVEGMMVVADGLLSVGMKLEELRILFKENPGTLVY